MTPSRWRQIERVFHDVLDVAPGQRAEFITKACAQDPELRREVELLLEQDSASLEVRRLSAWTGIGGNSLADLTQTVVAHGTQLGPYKIEGILGKGGMGEVFRAVDTRLGREVAIKISQERFSERFNREARAISSLNHPHICTLYDVGPHYLVMELCQGETLAARLKRGKLPIEETIRYGIQIAGALSAAHAKGIVHRDLKPGNIMITSHGVKVLDFGLAKIDSEANLTEANVVVGTPAYMAPEQMEHGEADARADLFALGLVLYEMAAGKPPVPGKSLGRILGSGASAASPRLSDQGTDIPGTLDDLVAKLLEKDPARRYQSAERVSADLSAFANRLMAPPVSARSFFLRRKVLVTASAAILLAITGGIALYQRAERQRWAREDAIPEINRLTEDSKPLAAFQVLRKAEQYLPADARLAKVAQSSTRFISVNSAPAGALVEFQDYLAPEAPWYSLGKTPVTKVRVPNGYFRWKLSKPGLPDYVAAPPLSDSMQFPLESLDSTPAGMVHVPGGTAGAMIDFIGWLLNQLPPFEIDRFEVTNRQYQQFVDQGGYSKREYWKEKFIKDGAGLTWEQAMDLFRDSTDRPGPATWEGGHFPAGQDDYPVSGVSWYEASAYAASLGKNLPALAQWYRASDPNFARYVIDQSDFGGRGPARVGTSHGVGPYGTYDMAGNVREWSLNAIDGDRYLILGGSWKTQTYLAVDPEALAPFDRSPLNGFRCVLNRVALPAEVSAPIVHKERDFSKVVPASDKDFQIYKAMYAYDHAPLNVESDGVVERNADWTKEKITIDAGHGNERLPMYLFLPTNVRPPFQTMLFFPSARVAFMPSSQTLGDMQFVDYIIKSGRALLYPIFKGTYERVGNRRLPGTFGYRDLVIAQSQEVGRAVDFLETRPEIDKTKFGYIGVSAGTAFGVIYTAIEDRFKTIVFLDGGFFLNQPATGRDQADFAPRIKKPVLMVNGRYDFTFSPARAQDPLFRMLGTPTADKKHVIFDTPHDISQNKPQLSKEVLEWLDKYLGKVR